MARVTSKLQVTIPKSVAVRHGIEPGTDLVFESAGDTIRIRLGGEGPPEAHDPASRIARFDEATCRQAERDRRFRRKHAELLEQATRGWSREDLYDRGLAR